jgi:ribosomal protein S18 acetylase RimI-like enzyme
MASPDRLSLEPLTEHEVPAVCALLATQDNRLYVADSRLRRPRLTVELDAVVREYVQADTFLFRDEGGMLLAAAVPDVWQIDPASETLGFFRSRTGVVRLLALPDPATPQGTRIIETLLEALEAWWLAHKVEGKYINWPAVDGRMGDILIAHRFARDVTGALRQLASGPPPQALPDLIVRRARAEDEEALVALHLEELRFHEAYTPHVRVVPATETAFTERLQRVWRGEPVEDGASLIMVAERHGDLLGFTENWLSSMGGNWFPVGRYGYLNSVGVRTDARGEGIGRLLASATLQALATYDIDAYTLYFAYNNPLSSRFWPRMGFRPLADSYKHHY